MTASICKTFTGSPWTREFCSKCSFMFSNVWMDLELIVSLHPFHYINKVTTPCAPQWTLLVRMFKSKGLKSIHFQQVFFPSQQWQWQCGTLFHMNPVLLPHFIVWKKDCKPTCSEHNLAALFQFAEFVCVFLPFVYKITYDFHFGAMI